MAFSTKKSATVRSSLSASYGATSRSFSDLSEEPKVIIVIGDVEKDGPASESTSILSFVRKTSWLSILNVALMCLIVGGHGMCFSLFAPFFPNEANRKGMGPTTVGILFGSFELIMFIGTPLSGKAVHHLGLRFMIGAGMLLNGATTMLFGLVDQSPDGTIYIVLCFAIRIVEACGASLFITASYCVAGNLFPDNIAFVFSLMETANGVGMIVGPSVGGLLYAVDGFYTPFVTVGAILLVFGLISTVLLPASAVSGEIIQVDENGNRVAKPNNNKKQQSLPWSRLFRVSIEAWVVLCAEAVGALLSNFPEPTLSIYFESLGLYDPATVGAIFLASSLVYTVACIVFGHFADKYPNHVYSFMSVGALVSAVCFFIMGPPPFIDHIIAPSVALTATAEILLYSGIGLILVSIPRALLNAVKNAGFSEGLETSAMIAGLYNGLWFMGGFTGPPIAGLLLETVGFQWGTTIMALISLALAGVLAAYHRFPASIRSHQFGYAVLDEEEEEESEDDEEKTDETDEKDVADLFSHASLESHKLFPSSGFAARPNPAHGAFALSVSLG